MTPKSAPVQLAALTALGASGVTSFLAMPVIASSLANQLGITDARIGVYSMVQLLTLSVGCVISIFLPRGRVALYGRFALIVMVLCELASISGPSWHIFLALRAIGGCAGGIAISQATGAMAATRNPERTFGLFQALQTMITVAFVYCIPPLVSKFGFSASYVPLLIFELIALALVLTSLQANAQDTGQVPVVRKAATNWSQSIALLLSIFFFFVGVGAIWTFIALLGQRIGLGSAEISTIVALSQISGFIAAFIPGFVGTRFGRRIPIAACTLAMLAALQAMALSGTFQLFVIATLCFSFAWYMLYPFQLAALAAVDGDGRPTLASAALVGAGLGTGPILATTSGLGIYGTATIAYAISGAVAVLALSVRRLRKQTEVN